MPGSGLWVTGESASVGRHRATSSRTPTTQVAVAATPLASGMRRTLRIRAPGPLADRVKPVSIEQDIFDCLHQQDYEAAFASIDLETSNIVDPSTGKDIFMTLITHAIHEARDGFVPIGDDELASCLQILLFDRGYQMFKATELKADHKSRDIADYLGFLRGVADRYPKTINMLRDALNDLSGLT